MSILHSSPNHLQSDDDVLVRAANVSKKFCLSLKKSLWYGLKDMRNELMGRRHGGNGELRPKEFWAVNDVNFELRRGESLGLIGQNGAGKTTLLKMLNGLIKPDSGQIVMRGRIGALIALGAGFNPILTGRENIYVNASVLGMSKQDTDHIFEKIVDFADIGEFIDTPVQNYSSGMSVRLGFSIASMLNPDILLVDEVLAVGDYQFALKCYRRIGELLNQGTSVILVSHQMQTIANFCSRAALMEHGRLQLYDNVDEAITRYKLQSPTASDSNEAVAADNGLCIHGQFDNGAASGKIRAGLPGRFRFSLEGLTTEEEAFCEVTFKDLGGHLLMRERSDPRPINPMDSTFTLTYDAFPLYLPQLVVGVSFWLGKGRLLAWHPEVLKLTGIGEEGQTEPVLGQGNWRHADKGES